MKRLSVVVAICAFAVLYALLWFFVKRPANIEASFLGTWSGMPYPVPGEDYPVELVVRGDHTLTFGSARGYWHVEGQEIVLELPGQKGAHRLHIEPDHGDLTDGYTDGWRFLRVATNKKSD